MSGPRGTGRTTAQMRAAPPAAVYVWPADGSVPYALALARHLGRGDLQITQPRWLAALAGQSISGLVVDHACDGQLTRHHRDIIAVALAHVRHAGGVDA